MTEKETYSVILRNFELLADNLTPEDTKNILAGRIRELLDKNVEKLLSILYRIDINQEKIDEIFNNSSKDEIAKQITEAVIQRQLLKVKTREIYKNRENRLE